MTAAYEIRQSASELGQITTLGCVCLFSKESWREKKNKEWILLGGRGENLRVVGRRIIIVVQRTLSKLKLMRDGWTVSRTR